MMIDDDEIFLSVCILCPEALCKNQYPTLKISNEVELTW